MTNSHLFCFRKHQGNNNQYGGAKAVKEPKLSRELPAKSAQGVDIQSDVRKMGCDD